MNTEEKIPRSNVIKAFLLAPLTPAVAFTSVAMVLAVISGLNKWWCSKNGFWGIFEIFYIVIFGGVIWLILAILVTYSFTAILGIPAYFLYKKIGLRSLRAYLLGSLFLGILCSSPIIYYFPYKSDEIIILMSLGAFFGAITGYAFWKVVHKKTLPW